LGWFGATLSGWAGSLSLADVPYLVMYLFMGLGPMGAVVVWRLQHQRRPK